MAQENLNPYLTGISHSVALVMAGSRHTLVICLSKLRSRQEAAYSMAIVSLNKKCNIISRHMKDYIQLGIDN